MLKENPLYNETCRMMVNAGYDPELLVEAKYGNFDAIQYDDCFIAFNLADLHHMLKSFGLDKVQLTIAKANGE